MALIISTQNGNVMVLKRELSRREGYFVPFSFLILERIKEFLLILEHQQEGSGVQYLGRAVTANCNITDNPMI